MHLRDSRSNGIPKDLSVFLSVPQDPSRKARLARPDRLFTTAQPGGESRDFLNDLNADSVRVNRAQLEPSLCDAAPEDRFQFERHGYFVADRVDSKPGAPVFNRTVTLKAAWAKIEGAARARA